MFTVALLARTGGETARVLSDWRRPRWWIGLALVAACAVAAVFERPLQALLVGHGRALDALAHVANTCGGGVAVTLVGLASFAAGRALRKDALAQAALVLGAAGCWCFALVELGRLALAEPRPIEGGAMRFFALDGHGVSGHAAATALLLLPARDVLLRGARPWVRVAASAVLVLWIGIVAWSRVWLGMHYAWNVLAGLVLGAWTSAAAVDAWRALTAPGARPRRAGSPAAGRDRGRARRARPSRLHRRS